MRPSTPDTQTGNDLRGVLEQSSHSPDDLLTLKRRGNTLAGWPLMTKRREFSLRRLASRSSRHWSRNLGKMKKRALILKRFYVSNTLMLARPSVRPPVEHRLPNMPCDITAGQRSPDTSGSCSSIVSDWTAAVSVRNPLPGPGPALPLRLTLNQTQAH